jgi:hypothetical protein
MFIEVHLSNGGKAAIRSDDVSAVLQQPIGCKIVVLDSIFETDQREPYRYVLKKLGWTKPPALAGEDVENWEGDWLAIRGTHTLEEALAKVRAYEGYSLPSVEQLRTLAPYTGLSYDRFWTNYGNQAQIIVPNLVEKKVSLNAKLGVLLVKESK